MSFLGCKALCIIMSFFVLWSICWGSSMGHFKNIHEYLTRGTAQVFIPLMGFLLRSLVSSSFLVLLFKFFLSSLHLWLCPLPIFPSICKFSCSLSILRAFWFCLDLAVLFLWSYVVSTFHYKHGTFFHGNITIIKFIIGLMGSVFTNGLGDGGSFQGRVIPKTQKLVLDATLLSTQHSKVQIKGKVE